MIDNSIDINSLIKLGILKKCVLIRNIVGIKKVLLYKYKKYDCNNNTIEQVKVECPIENIKKTIKFMESINYKKLFHIYDRCIVYANNKTELVVQLVNDKYIFIEMESKFEYINEEFDSAEDLIENTNQYDLPFSKESYFVKKAELVLGNI